MVSVLYSFASSSTVKKLRRTRCWASEESVLRQKSGCVNFGQYPSLALLLSPEIAVFHLYINNQYTCLTEWSDIQIFISSLLVSLIFEWVKTCCFKYCICLFWHLNFCSVTALSCSLLGLLAKQLDGVSAFFVSIPQLQSCGVCFFGLSEPELIDLWVTLILASASVCVPWVCMYVCIF